MPELPEVETVRLGLQKYLAGHKILDVEVKVPKIFGGDKKNIIGARVVDIDRLGKGLIIELDNGYVIAIHLKLTGQIIYSGKDLGKVSLSKKTGGSLPSKYTHVIFRLKAQNSKRKTTDQNSKLKIQKEEFDYLYFNDMRKFGWIKVVKKEKIRELPFFKEMGPEPPVVDSSKNNLTIEQFSNIVSRRNIPIKILLLDQKKISGIGNIYANEALFEARIDPRHRAKDLSDKEIDKLYDSIIDVLKKGIKYGGASDVNFVNAIGEDGKYQNHFLVYGREGKKCFGCKGTVEKIQLGGRGTYFCKTCQK